MSNSPINLTAEIVSAFVSNNPVPQSELPALIGNVYAALARIFREKLKPAVPINKSVTPDFLISLEDGKRYKSLKRHLRTAYNMTPEQYRAKWDLPPDYPMVAPNYAKKRSELARSMGLGNKRKRQVTRQKAA